LVWVHVEAEVCTAASRIDAVIRTPKHILAMELKLDGNAEAARRQIKDKVCATQYLDSAAAVTLAGRTGLRPNAPGCKRPAPAPHPFSPLPLQPPVKRNPFLAQ